MDLRIFANIVTGSKRSPTSFNLQRANSQRRTNIVSKLPRDIEKLANQCRRQSDGSVSERHAVTGPSILNRDHDLCKSYGKIILGA